MRSCDYFIVAFENINLVWKYKFSKILIEYKLKFSWKYKFSIHSGKKYKINMSKYWI